MIDATFVNAIADRAVKAMTPQIIEVKGEPAGYYYLVQDGKAELVQAKRSPQTTKLSSIDMFEQFILDVGADGKLGKPSILVCMDGASLVFDRYNIRDCDKAGCSFEPTTPFAVLQKDGPGQLEQRNFIRTFRDVFGKCYDRSQELLHSVSEIRWENSANGSAMVRNGEEAMGNSIIRKVQGLDSVPPDLMLAVRPFNDPSLDVAYPCRCYLEVEPSTRTFKLYPFPDEIENIEAKALADIRLRLLKRFEAKIPVYIG